MNQKFHEFANLCQGFLVVDMATGANAADYVSLKNYGRVAIVLFKEPGTAGNDPVILVKQATANADGNSDLKAVPFKTVAKKQAATNLLAVGQYTISTSASPASNDTFDTTAGSWTNSDLAEQAGIIVIDIGPEDLDVANGFSWVTASIADVGTAGQLGGMLMIGYEPKFSPNPLLSAIA